VEYLNRPSGTSEAVAAEICNTVIVGETIRQRDGFSQETVW
jgi:hypothetical protein